MNKKAQSEMVGFAIIILIVAVLIVVFLSISLNKSHDDYVESYEVEGFLQSVLQYTTTCAKNYEPNYLDIKKLIFSCAGNEECLDGTTACTILNQTLSQMLELTWPVGQNSITKGYSFEIVANNASLVKLEEGNITQNSKGSLQSFSQASRRTNVDIFFVAYY